MSPGAASCDPSSGRRWRRCARCCRAACRRWLHAAGARVATLNWSVVSPEVVAACHDARRRGLRLDGQRPRARNPPPGCGRRRYHHRRSADPRPSALTRDSRRSCSPVSARPGARRRCGVGTRRHTAADHDGDDRDDHHGRHDDDRAGGRDPGRDRARRRRRRRAHDRRGGRCAPGRLRPAARARPRAHEDQGRAGAARHAAPARLRDAARAHRFARDDPRAARGRRQAERQGVRRAPREALRPDRPQPGAEAARVEAVRVEAARRTHALRSARSPPRSSPR